MAVDDWAPVQPAGTDDWAPVTAGDFQPVRKGVTAPDRIPQAFEDRLIAGEEARKREGGLLQTIPQGLEFISTPEGRTRLWEAVKKYPSKVIDDMINLGKLPGETAAGRIDLSTEEGADEAIGLGMLIAGGRLNKLSLTGKTSGMSVAMGESVSRITKGPMGEIYDLPIGTMARSEDFVVAAEMVGGEKTRGPWGSNGKVYDVFHGTDTPFERFDPAKLGSYTEAPSAREGFFFSKSAETANSYTKRFHATTDEMSPARRAEVEALEAQLAQETAPGVRSTRSKIQGLEDRIRELRYGDEAEIVYGEGSNVRPTQLEMSNPYIHDFKGSRHRDQSYSDIIKQAKEKGHDGVILENTYDGGPLDTIYVVFDPQQIKSRFQETGDYGGEAPLYVQEKMLKAYEEKGLHPSEMAHDAQVDPIVAQRLLSSDKDVLPEGGAPPREPPEPPAPPKPPEPPPEGSFEAAQKTILDKISVGERAPKEGWSWDKFYRRAIDDLHPLKDVDQGAYELARLTRGQFGKAEHFIQHGTFDFNTYKTNGKPLAEILDPVSKDLDGFRAYLASKRGLEIEASGRKSGMDVEAATRVAAEGEGAYGKAAAELVTYQNKTLQYLKDSGVLSQKSFDAMVEAGKNYVPFYRVMEPETGGAAGKSFGPGNPVKKLKGSERDVVDPLESIIKNTYAYISIAERNAVGIKLIDALKQDGAEVTVAKRAPSDPELVSYLKEHGVTDPEAIVDFVKTAVPEQGGDTLGAFRNGVKETVKVNDPELVAAFRGLDQQSADMLVKVLAFPAKTLRAGATLSPDFMVRNVVRDFMTAFVNSKGALFSPIDTFKGARGVLTKDADFQDWLKGGGANATMVALDRRYMQESLATLTGQTGLMDRSWNVVTSPIRGLRMVSELAENATRLGEFKKLTGESKGEIQSAAMASREVTLDFARIGASMRAYNMITAFGNAQIQGLDRVGRAFADRPFNTTAKVAGGITLPSVLLWFANKDDPRYKELPHWQKDLFWIVMTKDHIYRIPKPFELGVVFGSGVERILDQTVGDNPEAFDKFAKSIIEIVTPNAIPTAVQPLVEQWANRSSMSDRTLIPSNMEKWLPEYQYTPYTTELAKKMGQIVSAFPGMRASAVGPGAPFGPIARATSSPILLENYVRSWTGGLGMYALQAADASLRKAGVLPDPVKPTDTLADIPVVKAFMVRYPSATTQSIQDFYDQHEVTKKFYDTWLAKAREGDVDAMSRIQAAGGPMMFVRLDAIKETLTEHNKLVRDIYKNPTVKPEEKRQLIDSLYFNMIEIGKAGKTMVKDAEKALKRATEAAP